MLLTSIIILALLLLLSAFFSGSETGITAASRAKIYKLKMEGNKRAKLVGKLLAKKDRLISTILLGNNFANSCASAFAAAVTIQMFGDDKESNAVIIVTVILTFAIIIFSEVLPKTYALMYSEKVALAVAPIIYVLIKILSPVSFFVEKVVSFLIKIFKLENHGMQHVVHGLDAIRGAIEMHHHQGDVIKEDRDMLGSILDLDRINVSEVMKHRKYMEAFDVNIPPQELLMKILEGQYSRIPFYKDNPDNIIGLLHVKDYIKTLHEKAFGDVNRVNLSAILMEPWFVPDTTTLREQLIAFRERHSHFALVVDEYGTLLGHVTLEDILEEIVGNIEDEHDKKTYKIEETLEGYFIIDGAMPIRDLNRELDINLPSDEASTVAGLVINNAEMIPSVGQAFNFFGYRFEILKKRRHQITKIKLSRV